MIRKNGDRSELPARRASTQTKVRSWHNYSRAFGRAHRKASAELEGSMPLLRHLEELRKRIFKAFLGVILTTILSFAFAPPLINFLASPIGGSQALVSIEVTENMAIFMRVSILSGLVLGMPFVIYQVFNFILPGLKKRERLWLILGVPAASLLFAGGVAFAWFIMLPEAIQFLVNFLNITTQVRPANYFEFITSVMFWIGVSFEMPLVTAILAKFKLITARKLAGGWRYAFVAIALVAAMITPTIDPVNMGLVMLPLCGLYAISVLMAAIAGRG